MAAGALGTAGQPMTRHRTGALHSFKRLGHTGNPLHPDGLLAFYQFLIEQGFSVAEIDRMGKINPAKALGLKP